MDFLKAILVGIIQGLTEFLPISSSAHLVLIEDILHFNIGGLTFEVAVHFGTLLAVMLYFYDEVLKMVVAPFYISHLFSPVKQKESVWSKYLIFDLFIIVATIPAAFVGLLFEDQIEAAFNSPVLALFMLSVTGLILLSYRFVKERDVPLTMSKSFLIGIAQAFAIIPGISRSGSTIMTGIWTGLDKETAAKFSFLLSIPAILGATILKFSDILSGSHSSHELLLIFVATIASFISGYIAIAFLISIIKKNKLDYFGYYCLIISIGGLLVKFIGG
jgi:undecaprenyl-diphosphatase